MEQQFLDEMTDGHGKKVSELPGVLNKIRPRSLEKFNHAIKNGCKSIKAK